MSNFSRLQRAHDNAEPAPDQETCCVCGRDAGAGFKSAVKGSKLAWCSNECYETDAEDSKAEAPADTDSRSRTLGAYAFIFDDV